MNVEYLLQLLGNRLNALNMSKEQAFLTGDLERINTLDTEINGVLDTINKLKLLEGISQTAMVTPFTEAEVVKNGIEASFNLNNTNAVYSGDATGCLLGYDITSYATDPLHEEKIADILNYIGDMDTVEKIDTYIDSEAIESPITGAMILNSAMKYNVDQRLMMAIMELDSRFGTAGIAVRTLNPGNVGNNDDGDTRTYPSWQDGVDAVALWLSKHRIEAPEKIEEQIIDEEEEIEEPVEEEVESEEIITPPDTVINEPEEVITTQEEIIENLPTEPIEVQESTDPVVRIKQRRTRRV